MLCLLAALSTPQEIFVKIVQSGIDLHTAIVWSAALKYWIQPAYLLSHQDAKRPVFVVLFSTDLDQGTKAIYRLYQLRFRIEFIFRNAKQFTELQACQGSVSPPKEKNENRENLLPMRSLP
jgi:hypothetical protein